MNQPGKLSRRDVLKWGVVASGASLLAGCATNEAGGTAKKSPSSAPPDPTNGWPTASPESQGVDSRMLERLPKYVAERMPELHGLVLVRHGHLVWERYFPAQERDLVWTGGGQGLELPWSEPYATGESANQLHNVKSVTKCFVSALVEIAISKGLMKPQQTLGDFLPSAFTEGVDPKKRRISVENLLTMRSGLEWEELGMIAGRWVQSGDPFGFTMREQKVVAEPGERWDYSSADTHVLSACLTAATGMPALEFADRHLFSRLGIRARRWSADTRGYTIGASELCLTPRDMAKLGLLYLHRGRWDGEPVVPEEWVALTIAPQPGVTSDTILGYLASAGVPTNEDMRRYRQGYGYKWWRGTLAGHPTYYAAGHGGQYVFVFDDLDLVVVQTAKSRLEPQDLFSPPRSVGDRLFSGYKLMEDLVLPAVT
ncbi:MAG: serine hydrolase [Planctomycetes bacterium]|nr:serine hydrolase [Planctomycetota bacterium]MBI3848192.1 serine hydrolase [Planctomycetota bacterium]